jgi:acetyl-CoA carboxylase biotin carboxylase subunit
MFKKILIANRGEVALRIIRACKEMGIRTVAIYSEVDDHSLHVRFADEAVCVGPAENVKSYLSIPAIISAAEVTGVDAIHPGYGFLAEHVHFAEICETCRIAFIGPSPRVMKLMGDKSAAREVARKAGLPLIPGSRDIIHDEQEGLEVIREIGLPVMVKAAAGGGGKGMRLVSQESHFGNQFLAARTEAQAAFDSPEVYLEKFIEDARHIEFQILADHHGRVLQLGERDCSIQRRHQKIIEESPSPALSPKLRREIEKMAVRIAEKVEYIGAGTVEFLVDGKDDFFFMEMNTRIQVEHPVTEMQTGLDLIKEQIHVAAGEKIAYGPKETKSTGHTIECRINAEDPEKFIPSAGLITDYHQPGGPGIRVDSAAYAGYRMLPYYDSLVAKLIAHGHNREEAIMRLRRGLEEFIIGGIQTTIPLHRRILQDPDFVAGRFSTQYLDRFLKRSQDKS